MMEPRVSGPALTTVKRLRPYSVNIFAAMSALATEVGAVNLGQGFPDEDGPPAMLEAARRAIAEGVNQYPPGPGIAALREAIAAQRMRRYRMAFDPGSEVLVTVGASEAIAAAVLGLVEPGSEVLLIEPFFDTYSPVIAMAGSRRVSVSLVPNGRGFALDIDAVQKKMPEWGIAPKAVVEGPPSRKAAILLRQTSFKALNEVVSFEGEVGTHTARFGEIEQRGVALKPAGRALYDACLAKTRARAAVGVTGEGAGDYMAALAADFAEMPDDIDTLRRDGLAYFKYRAKGGERPAAATVEELINAGALIADPQTYEDFLPVSAAGIFQSNLGTDEQSNFATSSYREILEAALGVTILDEQSLYAGREAESLTQALTALGQAHLI